MNIKLLKNDLDKFVSCVNNKFDYNMIENDYFSFLALKELYEFLTFKKYSYDFKNIKLIEKCSNKTLIENISMLNDFYKNNKDILINTFNNCSKYLNECSHDKSFIPMFNTYNKKTFNDMILSYFSTYGSDIYNIVKKYFDEDRILFDNAFTNYIDSTYVCGLIGMKSQYIALDHFSYSTLNAISLCHELGHVIDSEICYFPSNKKDYYLGDALGETTSIAYEFGFLNFLIKNGIDIKYADYKFKERIYKLNDCYNDLVYINNNAKEIDMYGDVLCENGEIYPFRSDIIYGLGIYFSLIFQYLKDNMSIIEFNNMLYDFSFNRLDRTLEESIKSIGISKNEFISSNVVSKTLKRL